MAKQIQRREDLLNDAVAYDRRVRLTLVFPEHACDFFAGYRSGRGWSFYFDEAPVLQFTEAGSLRRLFIDEQKLAAENGHLVALERLAGEKETRVSHRRVRLTAESELAVLQRCLDWFRRAETALKEGRYTLIGQVPVADENLLDELAQQLAFLAKGFHIAQSAAS